MIIYPQKTQKTLNYCDAFLPDCGGWQSLHAVVLIELGYFSAKDAKDAKFYKMMDLVQVAATSSRPEYSGSHDLMGLSSSIRKPALMVITGDNQWYRVKKIASLASLAENKFKLSDYSGHDAKWF